MSAELDEFTTPNSDEDDEILEIANKLYSIDKLHWDMIYDKAREDLEFLSDDPSAQWNEKEWNDRYKTGRPTVTVDYLTQFVHQVANNIRMNTPSINPIPCGPGIEEETTDVIKGLIRSIEYNSCADEVYDTGATSAVKCSIGFALIDHDYENDGDYGDERDFHQQLLIKRVVNPFIIYMDSSSIESDGRDQNHCIVLEQIKADQFSKDFPDAEPISFGTADKDGTKSPVKDDNEVTIAQFFIKDTEEELLEAVNAKGEKVSRTKKSTIINRYKLSGTRVLSKTTFPGDYIPVVPFYGEEAWIDGKRSLYSLIRKSKPAQRMRNLMKSVEFEVLLKQPLAPVMVPSGAIENYKDDWMFPSKSMALRYDTFDAENRPLPPPQRLQPPQVATGMVEAGNAAVDDIKASMGLYNNAIGEQGQEVSGKAINARKIQGDVATYHFGDNAVRSITQIGRVLVCAIPEIYDSERVIQIMDEENIPKAVAINGATSPDQPETIDLRKGKYDVRVITGQSFTTRRQESASFYEEVIKAQPQMLQICGDLMFENMDIAGAQAMASRMRKIIDPKLLTDDKDAGTPQEQALKQQLDQAKTIIKAGVEQIQTLEQQLKDKTAPAMIKAQTDQQKIKMDTLVKLLDTANKDRFNDITEQKNAGELALAEEGMDTDTLLALMEKITAALPSQQSPQGVTGADNGAGLNGGQNGS